jgi:glycosyltransferase involved in cell wall biosynthesis
MHSVKPKLIRITTVPISLRLLLKGQMRFMKEHGFEVVMISSPGEDADLVEQQEECEMIVLPMERKINLLADLQSLIRLTKILRALEPDIVHTHTPKAGLLGMLAARFARVPVRLHTIAGLPWMEATGGSRFLLKWMERLTASLAQRVYPNSKGLYDFLLQERISARPEKIKLLGQGSSNGIDTRFFSRSAVDPQLSDRIKRQANLVAGGWVWIFAGRLVHDKGITELMTAFEQHHLRFPDDQLWLLGNEEEHLDPLTPTTKKIMQQHPGIRKWGFQQDVRPYFAAASVLVFPSYREGLPNVPLQAAAMGCALILSDINGCNEIVAHEEDGLLVPVKNSDAIAAAMESMRTQPERKEQFVQRSQAKIEKLYRQEQVWSMLLKEYKTMLQES